MVLPMAVNGRPEPGTATVDLRGAGGPVPRIGVEEEYHLVDLATRRLAPGSPSVLEDLRAAHEDRFKPELLRTAVELNSGVHGTLAQLREDLLDGRRALGAAAARHGLGLLAAGTPPLGDPADSGVSDDDRYARIREDYRRLADEQLICGMQVHVDHPDPDLAVLALGHLAPWLPPLLALGSSSPMWRGEDTGYASYRTLVWSRWPTAGPPPVLASAAAYDRHVQRLVDSGVIGDAGMLYHDVRPARRYPTLEVRICDSVPDLDDVVLLVALVRGLVTRALTDAAAGVAVPDQPHDLLMAARWRAARSGLQGPLLHPVTGLPASATEVAAAVVEHAREPLGTAGDLDDVTELLARALARGGSPARQRRVLARRGSVADVVDDLLATTAGEAA